MKSLDNLPSLALTLAFLAGAAGVQAHADDTMIRKNDSMALQKDGTMMKADDGMKKDAMMKSAEGQTGMRNKLMLAALLGVLNIGTARAADNAPVVLELFTSQGCSSCPPADALLKRLSVENNQLLPLSFHVDYWNYLGWKDPYSSPASTDRQRGYASALDGQVYTPELVVNGATAVVGSDEHRVRDAIKAAQRTISPVQVVITTKPDTSALDVAVSGTGTSGQKVVADIWEVTFRPYVQNHVERGENRGRMLDHVNNVTGLKYLGAWRGSAAHYMLNLPDNKDDRVAVLVQLPQYGRVLGLGTR